MRLQPSAGRQQPLMYYNMFSLPQSTSTIWLLKATPVSEARKAAVSPTCFNVGLVFSMSKALYCATNCSGGIPYCFAADSIHPEILFVSIKAPGQMQITFMPSPPHSVAITRVIPSTAALAAVMPAKLESLDRDNAAVKSKIVPSDWVCIIYFAANLEVRNCEPQIFSIGAINCSKVATVVDGRPPISL